MEEIINTSQAYRQKIYEMAIEYAPKFILAIIVLLIGLRIIKLITGILKKSL